MGDDEVEIRAGRICRATVSAFFRNMEWRVEKGSWCGTTLRGNSRDAGAKTGTRKTRVATFRVYACHLPVANHMRDAVPHYAFNDSLSHSQWPVTSIRWSWGMGGGFWKPASSLSLCRDSGRVLFVYGPFTGCMDPTAAPCDARVPVPSDHVGVPGAGARPVPKPRCAEGSRNSAKTEENHVNSKYVEPSQLSYP